MITYLGKKADSRVTQEIVRQLEAVTSAKDSEERLKSTINITSPLFSCIDHCVSTLKAEFLEFPFRFGLSTSDCVAADPLERPVSMNKTSSRANHIACAT